MQTNAAGKYFMFFGEIGKKKAWEDDLFNHIHQFFIKFTPIPFFRDSGYSSVSKFYYYGIAEL